MRYLGLTLALLIALPVAADDKKPDDFQGHYMTVKIGKRPTKTDFMHKGHGQLWKLTAMKDSEKDTEKTHKTSGKLIITVAGKPEKLGKLKQIAIVINPIKGDDPKAAMPWNPGDIWQPTHLNKFEAGKAYTIAKWRHIGGGKLSEHDALPTGSYMMHLTFHGEKTWDRQSIRLEIK